MKLSSKEQDIFQKAPFDFLSIGLIDFKNERYESFNYSKRKIETDVYYDLASISKPLTNGLVYLVNPNLFDNERLLLLNHQAGLPSWGKISINDWREFLGNYNLKRSETVYSDFSSLRLYIELDKADIKLFDQVKKTYRDNIIFWKDLGSQYCAPTGYRNKKIIQGIVNDDNAYNINDFVTHTGLFSTAEGLCKAVMALDIKYNLLETIYNESQKNEERFVCGWDRVVNTNDTLAGNGCSVGSFGHLGFTGTSLWIDPIRRLGYCLLTNATQNFWHERDGLNFLRRSIGERVWKGEF